MTFSPELEAKFTDLVTHYPEGRQRAALIPMLMFGQDEIGSVTQEMMDDLVKAGEADEVKLNKEQLQKSERLIKINMRGLIARSLYEAGDFYYMTNELNDTYMRAVKVLQENQMKDFKVQHY